MSVQFKDLEVFMKVAEFHSFTKAAELLFIAQPSISKSVQRLERELNVILLDRSSKNLRLTDAGKIVFDKSKAILLSIDNLSVSINDLSNLVTGHIKIGLPQIIGAVFFPKIAQAFSHQYPGVKLEIKEDSGPVTEKLVEKGGLDIGLIVLPIMNDQLTVTSIYQDEFCLCVSSTHHLANKHTISLLDLKYESFIMFAKSFALHNLIMNACKDAGFNPNIAFESTQWDLILELVSAQLGIAIVPRILASKLNQVEIVSIPIKSPIIEWNIGFITRRNAYQSNALKEFINTINTLYNNR
ncbi:LysR family transcriptional regulator [Bacillus massiliigorillae]|uniref:LysR family transcriptional regulator n=1 Tax=Bacillus massiliigorillae TaxID=1243664 RepID=UPI0003AA252B|nr:LysR family transcriptional regulator [Bacillus massiliigorillae]